MCMVASVGLIMTACHHDEKKTDDTVTTTDTTTVVTKPEEHKEEPKEHKEPKGEGTEHKETIPTEKGVPVVKDTTAPVKPKDESTVGGSTKKHVKPGGAH